jgi:hypothetical protein
MKLKRMATGIVAAFSVLALALPAGATTKGLNQIVTPDIQPEGQLSISYQQQDPSIGNASEIQLELGITKRFEVAVFQGFSPGEQVLNAEYGIIQGTPWLLSAGFLGWSDTGSGAQPFVDGGWYKGPWQLSLGAVTVPGAPGHPNDEYTTEGIFGVAYKVDPRMQVQADYQTGSGNSTTAGFTYAVTPSLSFNPSLYVGNDPGHKAVGYAVLTYTITAFK